MNIGIDLGGTNMRLGVVGDGAIVKKEIIDCPSQESEATVVETLCSLIDRNIFPEVEAIGVGVPTLVDADRGIVYNATNIPSWKEVHLKEILEQRFGLRVNINNDANCFALGESRFGVGQGASSLVGVTLGTGVGGGLVIDGKLFCGRNTGAVEIGELPFKGRNFESYCSSVFFENEYGMSGKVAAELARGGDGAALAIWREYGKNVGELIKAVMFAYDPGVIVIGGGISSAYGLFEHSMREVVSTFPYKASIDNVKIVQSVLQDVAILGAAALV